MDILERLQRLKRKDARLIAAAPELLEQCKLFEKVHEGLHQGDSGAELELEKLREILAKVEGVRDEKEKQFKFNYTIDLVDWGSGSDEGENEEALSEWFDNLR